VFSVGIVGAGLITRQAHLPVLRNMPNVRIAWITDANDGAARAVARAFGLLQIVLPSGPAELPDCDVVLLAIPVGARQPYFEALARRRIAVFSEKPFALSYPQHKSIAELFPPH